MGTSTLVLLLAGPLQSWGEASRHMTRSTLTYPTKSGVTGLLSAALGRDRGSDLSDLVALRFGVRIDQSGQLITDYHTVSGASRAPLEREKQRLPKAGGGTHKASESTKVTRRQYLSDAMFIAAFEGDSGLLAESWDALARPRYPLYLGRRSCPPSRPVRKELRPECSLEDALDSIPWQAAEHVRKRHHDPEIKLNVVIDHPRGSETLNDLPDTSTPSRRQFSSRRVWHRSVHLVVRENTDADATLTEANELDEHDPFYLLPE